MILTLQLVNTALTLLFGILAALAWRRLGADRWRKPQAGWLLTGTCFVIVGAFGTLHAIASVVAVRGGSGSVLYRLVIDWGPVGNIGRSVATLAYSIALASLVAAPLHRVHQTASTARWVIAGATVAGTACAAAYGPMSVHTHMSVLAVLATGSVMAMLVTLLVGVMNDGMDLLLWLAVAVYTLKQTVEVSVITILAWWDITSGIEAALIFMWINVVAMTMASALAQVRLRRAIANRHVPALFERLHALRHPAES
jgi:hypothetical protein